MNRPSKKWDSSKDWTRITRMSMRIGEKTRFARIWPSASKIGIFLRIDSARICETLGVRIACPLSSPLNFGGGVSDSAIDDTISCNAPYSAIGFRGKLLLRYPPPSQAILLSLDCDSPLLLKEVGGCSSNSPRYHRNHSATVRKAPDTLNFLRHAMRAIWSVRPKCSHRCALSDGNPFKTCANPQAHNQKLSRANRYEKQMV